MKTSKKLLVIATMAFMLSVALFSGLAASAEAAPAAAPQTWYCDPGNVNKGIQFTLDNLAAPGDTICLWPEGWQTGNVYFYENVVVNYSVTILGLNHGRTAWEPRGSESYVYPLVDDSEAVFLIRADHVTIDGVFVGASGRSGTTWVTSEHGILADASDIETDTIDNISILNNFVESAITGIELDGAEVEDFYSFDNLVSGNFILSYYNAPQTALNGLEMTNDFFADVIYNKVKNIDDAYWVEYFEEEGIIYFEDNYIENTNVLLCDGIFVHEVYDDATITILGTVVVAYDNAGNAIAIDDVDPGVAVTIDGMIASGMFCGIDLEDVGTFETLDTEPVTYIDVPVVIMHLAITDSCKGLVVYNDDYELSEVDLSFAIFVDIDYDAIEVISDVLPPAPAVTAITYGWSEVNLVSDIIVNGADDAVEVVGPQSIVYSPAPDYSVSFLNVEYYYFNLIDTPWDIDATRIAFEGKLASEMNWTEVFDVEYKMYHAIDVIGNGFVMVLEDTAYVTDNKIIQKAIEVYGPVTGHTFYAETVYVMWGNLFIDDNVYIWHSVDLIGVTSEWGEHMGWIPWLFYDESGDVGYVIMIDDCSDVLVQNFGITGPDCDEEDYPADAVVVTSDEDMMEDISLVDLQIYEFFGSGMVFIGDGYAFGDILIEGCYVEDMDGRAVFLQATAYGTADEDILISHEVNIWNCTFDDCLEDNYITAPGEDYGFAGMVELWGISASSIVNCDFDETYEGDFNPEYWYLALLVTSGHENFVTGCDFDGAYHDGQNAVYIQTDADREYIASGVSFHPAPPTFTLNAFMVNSEEIVAPGLPEETYSMYYYEGDEDNYIEGGFEYPEVVNAAYNYWWSALGPYSDPDHVYNPNPDGTGTQVEDFINFAPWYMYDMYGLTADIFISEDKNDNRLFVDGDPVFFRIQAAVDAAAEGDWVIVNAGTYIETADIYKNISLLGGYVIRGGFLMAELWSDGSTYYTYTYILAVVDANVWIDRLHFLGDAENMVIFDGSTGSVSACDFSGAEVEDQIGLLVEWSSTVNVFNNNFYDISGHMGQDQGAVAVYSGSSADIYDNGFWGAEYATGVWAWDVTQPLDIIDNIFWGFYTAVQIDEFDDGSSGINIEDNEIYGPLIGIMMDDVADVNIEGNTIVGAEELPEWFAYDYDYSFDILVEDAGANVVIYHNNLLSEGNTDDTVGVWNCYSYGEGYSDVIADDNYWGKQSGPAGGSWYYDEGYWLESPFGDNVAYWMAWGGGTMVSLNVTYDSWLNMMYDAGASISAVFDAPIYMNGDATMYGDYYSSEDTGMDVYVPYGAGSAEVILGKYTASPGKMFWGYNLEIYVEIAICHEHMNLNQMTVFIYFGDADLSDINVDELRLFYWVPSEDGFSGSWMPVIGSIVNVEDKYVEMTFYAEGYYQGASYPSIEMLANDMAFLIGAPKLTLSPEEGKSGITIYGQASGFIPGDFVVAYLGGELLAAVPTQLKGVFMVDEDGNISDIQFILPFLSKGIYSISVSDVEYLYYVSFPDSSAPGDMYDIGEYEYAASADYKVLGNDPLALSLDVGAMYFAGEIVNWVASVTEEGTPYAVSPDMITAYLLYAPTGEKIPVPAENIIMVDDNTFVVTMTIGGDFPAGEYYLQLYVGSEETMYQGADGKMFLISQTFNDVVYSLVGIEDGIMTLSSQLDVLQLSVDEVNAKVTIIEGRTATIETTLGEVKTTVDNIELRVIGVQESIVTMQASLGAQIASGFSTVQSHLDDIDAQIVVIEDGIVTLQTSVGTVQTTLNQVAANVISIQDGVATLQTSVGTVQTTLNAIGAQVTTINGNVATLVTDMGEVQATLAAIQASIATLDGKVVVLNTVLGEVRTTTNAINATVTSIKGDTVTIQTTLGTIQGTLVTMNGQIATINTNLGTVKADVSSIASATTGINSTLAFVILAILVIVAIVLIFLRTKK